ncbi:AAA domain-containing protein [bacterium]|nr:AAA domain-containing protein [bacterium]
MQEQFHKPKLLVLGLGISVTIFSMLVLGYVGTSPDIGLRGLLADTDYPDDVQGMVIRKTVSPVSFPHFPEPKEGDVLRRMHDRPIRTFMDYCLAIQYLRSVPIKPNGKLDLNTDLKEYGPNYFDSLVEIGTDRWVEIEFDRNGESMRGWLLVQSLPFSEILVSFVWLLIQASLFGISAFSAWHRPFDRSARLFFGMCGVAMGGFIGGFHWWVISSNPLLNVPFVVCAVLVPAVSLHFFLSYPRPLPPLDRAPQQTVLALYLVPSISALVMIGLFVVAWALSGGEMTAGTVAAVEWCLRTLRACIYLYLSFAAVCYFAMLVALTSEYLATSSVSERNQMKWMLRAGLFSLLPVVYTLGLALFDRTGLALGKARLPMFLASLSFTLAYAVGIARFKLMLVDQLVTRGMQYHATSLGLTIGYGICVALVASLAFDLHVTGMATGMLQQILSIGAVVTLSVLILTLSRDRLQKSIDRRFYREKYQLDKALQRVNLALGRLEDRHTLGQRMLTSCCEVLGAENAALYSRASSDGAFQLVAFNGEELLPDQFTMPVELAEKLSGTSPIQKSGGPLDTAMRNLLRQLKGELIYPVEADGEIDDVVVLGRRRDGTAYSAEDLTFLSTLIQFTTVALRSARAHQDFARLNEELQHKASRIDEQKRQIALLQAELTGANVTVRPEMPQEELRRDMIKGHSPAILEVLRTVKKVAVSESTVLLQGASGTGKELLAQALHENSPRRGGPLVRVHCAALSPSLLESELFGHVKGAFTGAHRDRIGRFEMANGGTLFLDEIGDISLETQIKLLRVLQTRSFEPVGGTRTVEVDVRLITATHQDLQKLIREGRFRDDLFYRLNVVNITLPTLSQRREDIFELAVHFLKKAAERSGKAITHIDPDALEVLNRYSWPGNIRELENVIERAVVMAESEDISIQELPPEVVQAVSQTPASAWTPPRPLQERVDIVPPRRVAVTPPLAAVTPHPGAAESDRHSAADEPVTSTVRDFTSVGQAVDESDVELLKRVLRQCGGNKSRAARHLGMPRSTFFSKLKKAGLL